MMNSPYEYSNLVSILSYMVFPIANNVIENNAWPSNVIYYGKVVRSMICIQTSL